jgi:hypothetical protein
MQALSANFFSEADATNIFACPWRAKISSAYKPLKNFFPKVKM